MNAQQAILFAQQVVDLIRSEKEDEARALFWQTFDELYPLLGSQQDLGDMVIFFYELDEYLNQPEAVRAGAVTKGLLLSSYEDMLVALSREGMLQ
jgi:hypothetical protein